MKILVTGGTGFIGSHTVVELQQSGFDVVIADNLCNSLKSVIYSIEKITGKLPEFEQTDLTSISETKKLFELHPDIQGVIHFAALKAVGESVEKPLLYYKNNIFSLVNLLEIMHQRNISSLVFSSSCTVYGQPEKLPVNENSPILPALSPYGNTKQICEEIISDNTLSTGLNAILLRYFNPIGAHETALIGELPLGVPNNLVPFITQTAIGKRKELKVYGNDYNTSDGTCIRDYIHVVDLSKAHVLALKRLTEKKNPEKREFFNLGTGKGYSVLEVIQSFEKVSGIKLPYSVVERRRGDIEQIWAGTSLANDVLQWKAEKNLDEMMLSAWNWEKYLHKNI